MPSRRSGRVRPRATSPMGRADVLLAITQWGGTIFSRPPSTLCFSARDSGTASMIRSQFAMWRCTASASLARTGNSCDMRESTSNCVIFFRFTLGLKSSWICFMPRAMPSGAVSYSTTRALGSLAMVTCAIPAPISPAPRTAMLRAGFSGLPNLFVLSAVEAKKMLMRAAAWGVWESLPNSSASTLRPSFIPFSSPVRAASAILKGAG
mmetsp:Transcript_35626/g.89541  ORF Transcript_35626/g.89541 Transcript_35626/m.89541 type:complete len:208 (-) Transcript_35626:153-776(-)